MSVLEQIFREAIKALDQRNLAEAERLFREVLRSKSNHVPALNLMTVVLMSTGRFAEAEPFIAKAISLAHGSDASHYNYGIILKHLNRPSEALQQFNEALKFNAAIAETWNNRGTIFNDLRQYKEAIADFDRALSIKPDFGEALANTAKSLIALEQYEESLVAYDRSLALNPNMAEAWLGRGTVLLALRRFDEAFAAFDKGVTIKPDLAEAWQGRGTALVALKDFEEAFAAYNKAVTLKPKLVEAWVGCGATAAELKRFDEALAAYDTALRIEPELAEAWMGRGIVLAELTRFDEAIAAYDKVLAVRSDLVEVWMNCGNAYLQLKQYKNAFAAFDRALRLRPELKYARGARLHTKMHLCDWDGIDAEILALLAEVRDGKLATVPFTILSIPATPADQLKCAKNFVAEQGSFSAIWRGEIYSHDRIRIAYISADFRNHPVAHLAAGLFEHHDRSRFEVTGIAIGPTDVSPLRRRLEKGFEHFIDAGGRAEAEIAHLIRNREIDIAVDLMGHTENSRLGIFARRPAPIQVHYLGYPGTLGASYIDYLIADSTVVPDEHRQFFSEKVVWLPDSYLVSDDRRVTARRARTRPECGLPETGFVFCSFNNAYKIPPNVFQIWLRLLKSTPDSVLWLSPLGPVAQDNLRNKAEQGGVSAQRLIFAPRLPEVSDHLERQRLADLFLDTLPYNAHTRASDALWAGLPVLTCLGETFAGRVAASLLKAAGLAELVTTSLEDYETLALELAHDAARLGAIREKLARHRDAYPLFNTARFTRHLEAALAIMWQAHQDGRAPVHFAVKTEAELACIQT
jgi:protein O-GlcNAc transferase